MIATSHTQNQPQAPSIFLHKWANTTDLQLDGRQAACIISLSLPEDVRENADQAMHALQNGRPLWWKTRQPLHGKLSGVEEIRIPYDDNTYRVYLTLKCPWAVVVLDAGMKKSTEGKNIPKWQKERLEIRFKNARDYCLSHASDLEADYDGRKARRDEIAKERRR